MTNIGRTLAVVVVVFGANLGCGNSPTAPRPGESPNAVPMTIVAISPTAGSTGGDTSLQITGSGFQSGATVSVDGIQRGGEILNSTSIHVSTPPHAAGQVDIVVTNPDGRTARLGAAYTYVPPESFDFTGDWEGHALAHPTADRFTPAHADMEIRFTIQNGRLTSVTCGGSSVPALSPPPVSNGEFAFVGDGIVMSGRIVSAVTALGTIDTDGCPATRWAAARRQ